MIAIVDYQAGNLTSVRLALEGVGAVRARVTSDPQLVLDAERIVFPGVGAAGSAMAALRERGLDTALRTAAERGTPLLCVCVGMQLLFESSEEDGGTGGLGILPGHVRRFAPASARVKIPHMGWNALRFARPHPLLEGIADGSEFYFVHSYYCAPSEAALAVAHTDYADVSFASAVARENLFALQCHPERSGRIGQRVYANFLRWKGGVC
jgi:glutamine amidotransferase